VVHRVSRGLGQSCKKYIRSDLGDSCQSDAVEFLLKLSLVESVNASARGDPNGPVRIFGETSDDGFRELVFQRLDESASVKEVEPLRPSLAPGEPKASTAVFEWEHAAWGSIGRANGQERILLRVRQRGRQQAEDADARKAHTIPCGFVCQGCHCYKCRKSSFVVSVKQTEAAVKSVCLCDRIGKLISVTGR
jgi:hypothetical protein